MRLALAAAVVVALLAVLPAGSATRPSPPVLIAKGLAQAVEAGQLTPAEAVGYSGDLARAHVEAKRLPPLRGLLLDTVIADVAAQWRSYTRPRALTLFGTLRLNTDWFAGHAVLGRHPDVAGDDGAVYRFFSGHGYVFHPLANFAKLNSLVSAGDTEGAEQLAGALLARAVPAGNAVVWEYEFPFGSGRPPWRSGMAQAVAAQALARAGDLLSEPALLDAADAAYASLPRLLSSRAPSKPWVALYSFDRVPVLNAQLQAALSIGDYAAIAGDPGAEAFAAQLTDAARALLPRFDTGYWSLYSLRGDESPLDYHDYVITLLRKLAARTGDTSWREVADRFQTYESQPPVIHLGTPSPTLYPRPKDGYRDEARIGFWLSKRSRLTLLVGGERVTGTLRRGWNTLVWPAGKAPPGVYHPFLTAVATAGGRTTAALPPLTIARAPGAPPLDVTVSAPSTLSWSSDAEGTPWLHLRLRLRGAGEHVIDLGRRGLAGTRHLSLPPGRWHVTLLASNSAGRTRTRSLGYLPR